MESLTGLVIEHWSAVCRYLRFDSPTCKLRIFFLSHAHDKVTKNMGICLNDY